MQLKRHVWIGGASVLMIACASAETTGSEAAPGETANTPATPEETAQPELRAESVPGAELLQRRIDASSNEDWVYFELDGEETGRVVDGSEAGWDLAFRRFNVISNGGVSGDGGVVAAVVSDADAFAEMRVAPDSDYRADAAAAAEDAEASRGAIVADSAFLGETAWYDYNPVGHVVTPNAARFYVVVTTEGAYFKLRFLDYYNDSGSPAHIAIEFAAIAAPEAD